jgi:uncharacterized tellurite resistance protein B-like protein
LNIERFKPLIMEQTEKLLKDYSDIEKGSYLGAIASIATADRSASEEELEYIQALADSADLSQQQKEAVETAATELSGEELKKCLDNLKNSELRFSLITDLIAFAESDQNYTSEEKANIEKIAQYLNINKQQFSLLDQFVKKTAETNVAPQEIQQQGFLGSLGLEDKFKSAGINFGSLTKGLLGFAGPMILGGLLSRGMRGRSGGGGLGGMLGGGLGGMLGGGGGLGGMLGGGGGLGSLTSMLNGGRGLGSTGGLFSRILRGF